MRTMRHLSLLGLLALAGCHHAARVRTAPDPLVDLQNTRALFRRGRFDKTLILFQRLTFELPPSDSNQAEVHYGTAESYFQTGDLVEAAHEFRQVADAYPTSPYAPLALLRAGDANLRMWRRPELDPTPGQDALAIYQELAGRFPGTGAAGRAQVHVRQLKDQFAEKAYKNGMFYLKRGAYDSAIIYFKDVIASYPEAARTVDALFRLAEIYRTIRYTDEFKETCDHLQRYYPRARGLAVLCPAPTTSAATP